MTPRPYFLLLISAIFWFGFVPVTALAQGASERGGPALERGPAQPPASGRSPRTSQRGWSGPGPEDSAQRKREARRGTKGLAVPKGHLPPPGQCRLWFPGRPPGHQPPPISCRNAYQQQRAPAVVVTHHGTAPRPPAPRWQSRPAGDFGFRHPPQRPGDGRFSVRIIIDILGQEGVRRLEETRRRLGIDGTITGRWETTGPSGRGTLVIRAGRHPLARLVDRTGDGQVNDVYVRAGR